MMSDSLVGTLDLDKLTRRPGVLILSYQTIDIPVTLLRFSTDGETVEVVLRTSYDDIPALFVFSGLGPVRIEKDELELVIETAAIVKLTFGRKTVRLKFRANTYLQG